MNLQSDDVSSPRQPLRLVIAVAAGGLAGAIIGAGVTGYMQLLQELSALQTRFEFVAIATIIGGLTGALVGASVGLITGLIMVTRKRWRVAVRLR
jgi:pantothenate kinase type III